MTPIINLFLDALTLLVLTSYALSALMAFLPSLPASVAAWAFEARRRLLLPPLGALVVVTFGLWPHILAALGQTDEHAWLHLTQSSIFGGWHDLAVMAVLAMWGGRTLWNAFQWGQVRGRLRLLEAIAAPEREAVVRQMLREERLDWPGLILVVDFALPICFVYGIRKPRLLLSTAVLEALSRTDLRVIIHHELAHVARRDNLWRLLGQLATIGHLPGLGGRAFRRWALSAEAACDRAAATHVGSPVVVAEALVQYQRLLNKSGAERPSTARWVAAFEGVGTLEARIHLLLNPVSASLWHRLTAPWPWIALLLAAWKLDVLHGALEAVLALLHR